MFDQKLWIDPSFVMGANFYWKIRMDPGLVILKEFSVMVRCSCDQMDFWLGSRKRYVSQSIRRVWVQVMCVFWRSCGLGGRQVDQRFRNQGCALILTETLVLKDEICY